MASRGFMSRLKQFDAYPKTLEDFRVKTYGGATSELILYVSNRDLTNLYIILYISMIDHACNTSVLVHTHTMTE